MQKKTWAKLIIAVLLTVAIVTGIYLRWSPTGRGSGTPGNWGKGGLKGSERAYYESRIMRIIENWQDMATETERDKEGRLPESYNTFLVIDITKQAIWIEDNGQIQQHNHTDLPAGMSWKLHRFAPEGQSELPDKTRLKIRGVYSRGLSPEQFCLVGTGHGGGFLSFGFNASGRGSDHGSGRFASQRVNYNFQKTRKTKSVNVNSQKTRATEEYYGSLVVTDAEYERLRESLAGSAMPPTQSEIRPVLEKNRAGWLRVEKLLYSEIERQLLNAGFELRELKVEPGPDFSAGHAELRAATQSLLSGIFGDRAPGRAYLRIDDLSKDIWYVKSGPDPKWPIPPRRQIDLEFLVCPVRKIPKSQYDELLAKGRDKQQAVPRPSPKWQAVLSNGITVELLGICEHPNIDQKWWLPDGSPLQEPPFAKSTCRFSHGHQKVKVYCFAWRNSTVEYQTSRTAGSTGGGSGMMIDKYGSYIRSSGFNHTIDLLPEDMESTSVEFGFGTGNWQTPVVVTDSPGEINFLGKQRIVINPPKIENGRIVIRCNEEFRKRDREYQTDFGILLRENQTSKTVSLGRYQEDITHDRTTGIEEHTFTIDDLSMGSIEGVCFRYRPLSFVRFNKVSLVPGKDYGCTIELGGK